MRFFTYSLLLCGTLLMAASGCRSTSIQCERETALLRAEILDLEDKYYALKSQYERGVMGGTTGIVTNNVIGSGVIEGTPVVVDSWPVDGDVVYEDQIIHGGAPVLSSPTVDEYYDGQDIQPGIQGIPTPAQSEPADLSLPQTPAKPTTLNNDQTLVLPDAPELEVGYEKFDEAAFENREIERIEIVSSATRGKDLDGVAGHDGIELMIQALDANGDSIDHTGELTVTVTDPLAGEIGKWTFLPKELELFLSRDELGNLGTLLHLPWTDRIPVSKQVEIRASMMVGQIEYIVTSNLKIDPPTSQPSDNAIVGWAVDDDRWGSSTNESMPALSPSTAQNASPAVQRPQWKPVR